MRTRNNRLWRVENRGIQATMCLCERCGEAYEASLEHVCRKVNSYPQEGAGRMTQTDRVLRHLQDYGSITPHEALAEYGIMRLGARIWDLKKQGHVISTERETGVNRYGEKTAYARYRMVKRA